LLVGSEADADDGEGAGSLSVPAAVGKEMKENVA
jgi:hypothetical protein